jgi:RNA polymerase sigma-70 factor (ECF subfamily)
MGETGVNNANGDDSAELTASFHGDEAAFAKLFGRYRKRLKQTVKLRLDRRLFGRIDADDVLQEAFLEAFRKLPRYQENREIPVFLWLRLIVGEKLIDLHRHHLGVQARDADREISLYRGAMPAASSVALAAQLMGTLTSPSRAAMRAESKLQIQDALNRMDSLDREVLTLRNFELLSNSETAQVLGISQQAASNRYVRALKRMKEMMSVAR